MGTLSVSSGMQGLRGRACSEGRWTLRRVLRLDHRIDGFWMIEKRGSERWRTGAKRWYHERDGVYA